MSWANAHRRLTIVLKGALGRDLVPRDRTTALWVLLAVAVVCLGVLIAVNAWFTAHLLSLLQSAPPTTPQIDPRLIETIERLTREAVSGSSQSSPSWPIWVLVAVGVALVGAALVAIFRNEKSDGVSKILSGAIVSIGGVLAISKIGGTGSLPASWSDAAYAAILAILVCVGLAVVHASAGAPLPQGEPVSFQATHRRSRWVRILGAFVVFCCVLALLGMSPLLKSYIRSCPETKPCPPPPPGPISKPDPISKPTVAQRLSEVTGFPAGIADPNGEKCRNITPEEHAKITENMNRAIKDLKQLFAEKSVASLEIYASTDRSPLGPKCQKQFTTNRQLARARGDWVGRSLKAQGIEVPYVVYEGGPTEFGTKERALDRSVSIYGIIGEAKK